jgi:hypothetical protein
MKLPIVLILSIFAYSSARAMEISANEQKIKEYREELLYCARISDFLRYAEKFQFNDFAAASRNEMLACYKLMEKKQILEKSNK